MNEVFNKAIDMVMTSIRKFLRLESSSGIILLSATIFALVLDNTAASFLYQGLVHSPFSFQFLNFEFSQTFLFFVNDILMAIFFLLVGLELKREYCLGELSEPSKIILPAMAAFGGMVIPALFYVFFNYNDPETIKGWAIPVATDIAFALGILSLFGKRVPIQLKLFLLTLAIFDDLGAIIIIAIFYTKSLSFEFLALSILIFCILWLFNILKINKLWPFLLIGVLLWFCVLMTGVHPTIAGILVALMIPVNQNPEQSLLHKLEDTLHPWVAFLIMPLFAFANAGVSFSGLTVEIFSNPITLGIIAGLFLGKQVGVLFFTWVAVQLGWASLPRQVNWLDIYGIALLCGIGFTMSLFLGILAFEDVGAQFLTPVRIGVLFASLISGIASAFILVISSMSKSKRKRSLKS